MSEKIKNTLVEKINNSQWWHVTPQDSDAYKKRGKFLSSTYRRAEFYGRPNDIPEKVSISNPVYGKEIEILKHLFPNEHKTLYKTVANDCSSNWYINRINLDAKMYKKAKELGYDSIVVVGSSGKKLLTKSRKPHSIELNIFI